MVNTTAAMVSGGGKGGVLPLTSLNHISIVCRSVEESLDFYMNVLGFTPIRRPGSFDFDGAWLFNYGIGIHLLQSEHPESLPAKKEINPKDNHISFQQPLKRINFYEHQFLKSQIGETQITEIPTQIGNLEYFKRSDVGGTQITLLPTEISKLWRLKTLDARKSGLKEIPDQVLRLTGLVHLLIGDNESCEGVKLPDGIGKTTSLQQLYTIDLLKCSASSLKEIGKLWQLKNIAVVSSDTWEDTRKNNALLSSLESANLRSLVVYTDFRLSTLQSYLPYKNLKCRKKLPSGFAGQSFLGMLDIRFCKLEEDDLMILQKLPTKMIHISCEGLAKLENSYVDCRMPRVIFEEGAVAKLEHLELKLYAGSASEEHMCIKHLLNLQKVTLQCSE